MVLDARVGSSAEFEHRVDDVRFAPQEDGF